MERNIGKLDKQVRLIFVLISAILGMTKVITNDTIASILGIILLNFSPLSRLLGINTYKNKK